MKKLVLALPVALLGAVACVDRDRDEVYIEKRETTVTTPAPVTNPNAQPGRGEGERETPIIEAQPAQPSDDQLEGSEEIETEIETELEEGVELEHTGHDSP